MNLSIAVCVPVVDLLAEGPCWDADEGRLSWVDIKARKVFTWTPGRERAYIELPDEVSLALPRTRGGFVAAQVDQLIAGGPGRWREVCRIQPDNAHTRLNDGCCDTSGRLWIGTYSTRGQAEAGVYCIDPDGTVIQVQDEMVAANGIEWSADGRTLYLADTGRCRIDRFTLDPRDPSRTTLIHDGEVWVGDGAQGRPDGLTLDQNDNLWIAMWGGGRLLHLARDGNVLAEVPVPVTYPTAVCFGGARFRTLYVTTSSHHLDEPSREPLAGSLLACTPPLSGRQMPRYAG